MTEDYKPFEYCDCGACRQLHEMDELARKRDAALMKSGVRVFPHRNWPRQPKVACQSGERLRWLNMLTKPIRVLAPEEGDHGQAHDPAAQATEQPAAAGHDDV